MHKSVRPLLFNSQGDNHMPRTARKPFIGFIAPGFILYTVFMIVPLFTAVYYSFFEWSGLGPKTFIGFENYRNLFFDPRLSGIFWNALGNNFKFVA